MKFIISGTTGFIGSALTPMLRAKGNDVIRLVRVETILAVLLPCKKEDIFVH